MKTQPTTTPDAPPARRTKYDKRRSPDDAVNAENSALAIGGQAAHDAALAAAVKDYIAGEYALHVIERRHRLTKNTLRHALNSGHPLLHARPESDRLARAAAEVNFCHAAGTRYATDMLAKRWALKELNLVDHAAKLRVALKKAAARV